MLLSGFYAKDEAVVSASWDPKSKRADILVDPCPAERGGSDAGSLWVNRNLLRYSVVCSKEDFRLAFRCLGARGKA